MSQTPVIRILDASLNRASEGLRVVEDYVRFVLADPFLTKKTKAIRHDLAAAATMILTPDRHAARDTQLDVGTSISTDADGIASRCMGCLRRQSEADRAIVAEFGRVRKSSG